MQRGIIRDAYTPGRKYATTRVQVIKNLYHSIVYAAYIALI